MKASKPLINAMLICDKVINEAGTNKKSLIGIFESINVAKFPCVHQFLSVYIKLTDANGIYDFCLELYDLENGAVIGRTEMPGKADIKDPLTTHELVFNLNNLNFTHPGKYEFRLFANEEIFGQKTFLVSQVKER